MVGELILKELRDSLLSLRFQVGLLLALVLVSVSAFVLSTSYQRERSEHFQRLNQEDEVLRKYAHSNRIGMMIEARRPPSPLVLVRGLSDEARVETLDANPMLELHPPMDLTAIVAVILSLLGIVIGFDALNSEKERGTLRLMLANHLRRLDVVIAKWVSGTLVLVFAFVAAVLFGLIILRLRSGADWVGDDWLSVALACLVSLLYGGVFFSLALTFSAVFHRSSLSVLASLFAWVMFVLVIPNISPYVAAQIVRLPSRAALTRDVYYLISDERDELGRAGQRKVTEKYRNQFQLGDLAPDEVKRRAASDPEFGRLYDQYRREVEAVWNEVNQIQQAKAKRLEDAWQSLAESQFGLSKRLSYASPLPPLIYAATELSLTGFGSREDFDRKAEAYDRVLDEYLDARFSEEQKKDPTFSWNDFLDVSTRPRFTYVPPPFAERFASALPFVAFLVGWNLLFFTTAIFSFLRFDVR
jgi:ABC-type transport system involved in multi-copper enzyme maturation permease subunit